MSHVYSQVSTPSRGSRTRESQGRVERHVTAPTCLEDLVNTVTRDDDFDFGDDSSSE